MSADYFEKKGWLAAFWEAFPLFFVIVVLAYTAFVVVWLTAPLEVLLGESAPAIDSAMHGLVAGVLMVTVTIGLFEGYRLLVGNSVNAYELLFGSSVNALLAFLAIVTGNKIYIAYRASGGARSYFLEKAPEVHKIFFEFKEFMALLVFPLALATAFIILFYRRDLGKIKELKLVLFILSLLMFFYFVVTFGLGAAVTKLKSV
jgi:cytochrome bd-type quinol oxidase subunit 1